jgi:hypothetical protein
MGSSGLSTDSNTGDHVTLSAFQMGATPVTDQLAGAASTASASPQDRARIGAA